MKPYANEPSNSVAASGAYGDYNRICSEFVMQILSIIFLAQILKDKVYFIPSLSGETMHFADKYHSSRQN